MTDTPSQEFRDFSDFADAVTGGGLDLPIHGRTYRIVPASAEDGLYLTRLYAQMERASKGHAADISGFSDEDEVTLFRRILGGALDEMMRDGVPWPAVRLAMATGWAYHVHGEHAAKAVWNAGGDPKAAKAQGNRAQRRAQEAQERKATSTDRANTTPPQGSTSGTSSQQPNSHGGNRRKRRRGGRRR